METPDMLKAMGYGAMYNKELAYWYNRGLITFKEYLRLHSQNEEQYKLDHELSLLSRKGLIK